MAENIKQQLIKDNPVFSSKVRAIENDYLKELKRSN